MKKTLSSITVIVLLIMLLTGCYPTSQAPIGNSDNGNSDSGNSVIGNSEQSTDSQSSQQEIQLSDKFILDLNTPDNIPEEFPAIKLTLKTWDKEETERLFLSDKEITQTDEHDEVFYPGEKLYSWKTKDKLWIVTQPGRFDYEDMAETEGKFQYSSVYRFAMDDCNLIDDCYSTNGELSAFSSEDADRRAREMINKLGITNLGEPRVISVRAEFANMVLSYVKDSANKHGEEFEATPWTENEEVYILRYPQVFENTELSMYGITYEYADAARGCAIRDPGVIAVVSKDKIISLNILAIFSEDYEVVENIPVNCDADTAFYNFKEYLSNLVPMSTTKYYRCQPVYIPYCGTTDNMTVNFKLAWEFAGYSSHDDDDRYVATELENYLYRSQKYEYIWADTGHRYTSVTA